MWSIELSDDHLDGRRLYGDDLPLELIQRWYDEEETGYFDLLANHYKLADSGGAYRYEYEALNVFHCVSWLKKRRFNRCLALGCAAGHDVEPLAPIVGQFIAIEPAEKWWRGEIGGRPAQYMRPTVLGDIEVDSCSVDLATSFGVLHHIPNVSHVFGEISRVLKPGGYFVVREPVSWMGDWRLKRPGMTANERGLPVQWFEDVARAKRFKIVRRRVCMFGPISDIAKKMGASMPYSWTPFVVFDWVLSEGLRWNMHYRRNTFAKKIAPGSAFWILERQSV